MQVLQRINYYISCVSSLAKYRWVHSMSQTTFHLKLHDLVLSETISQPKIRFTKGVKQSTYLNC